MEKPKPCTLQVTVENGAATLESSLRFFKKFNLESPHDPEIPLLHYILDNRKFIFTQKLVHDFPDSIIHELSSENNPSVHQVINGHQNVVRPYRGVPVSHTR